MSDGSILRQDIEAAVRRFVTLANGDSLDAFADLYTGDALILMPGLAAVSGRQGARTFGERIRSRRPARLALVTHEVEGAGDDAWERGTSEWILPDGQSADRGKYIVIWRRTLAGWKLHRDIMNADTRPASR